MQFMQADSTYVNLKVLAKALTRPGMPSQMVIGKAAGVSQSTVSRAMSGLMGKSRGAQLLWAYVQSRPAESTNKQNISHRSERPASRSPYRKELKKAALDRLQAYLDDEFDPNLVIEQLGVLRRAQRHNVRGRKSQGAATR